ncbi:hypothetical protein ISS85_04395 [Candidatus Microgenomates bacterium]|nr:hypothetical protein [Candidatus Microgenomates bacterium]
MKIKEEYLVAIIIISVIFLSLIPNLYSFLNRQRLSPQRQWVYIHNYLYDSNSYLSKMKEGELGRWTVIEKYTSESHQGSLYQILYLWLGKIGGVFGFSVSLTHFLARIFLGFGWLIVIYLFLSYFLKEKLSRLSCFLMILLSAGYPRQLFRGLTTWYDWWSEFNIFMRATFLPHFLVGHLTIAGCFLLFAFSIQEKKTSKSLIYIFTAGLLALAAGIVLPPSLLTIYGGLAVFCLGALWLGDRQMILKVFKKSSVVFLLSVGSVFYFLKLFSQYPWKEIADWERTHLYLVDFKFYAFSQGTVFFFALAGTALLLLRFFLKKEKNLFFLLPTGWFVTHLFGLWFLNKTGLYLSLRFWQVASFVPAGILAVYFINHLARFFKSKLLRAFLLMVVFLTCLPGIFLNLKYIIDRENRLLTYNAELVPYPDVEHYPLKTLMKAINWLEQNTRPEEIVLSYFTAGNFIPAHAGNTVYIGNLSQTVKINQKYQQINNFFSGKFSLVEAESFLQQNKISYVFWGPQEKYWGKDLNQYSFLKKVYENEDVTIFAVKNEAKE